MAKSMVAVPVLANAKAPPAPFVPLVAEAELIVRDVVD